MQQERKKIIDHIQKHISSIGYKLSPKSKQYHALDSFVYEYVNAGGVNNPPLIEVGA